MDIFGEEEWHTPSRELVKHVKCKLEEIMPWHVLDTRQLEEQPSFCQRWRKKIGKLVSSQILHKMSQV